MLTSFNNHRHPHMARGDFMWGGYAVVIDPRIPREHVGHQVYPYWGHPFWQWLRRTVGIGYGLSMERGRPIMEGKIFMAQNKLFMTQDTFNPLSAAIR